MESASVENFDKDSISFDLRDSIDNYLSQNKLTLMEFAEQVGMSVRNIKDIVNNGRVPYVRNAISIYKVILNKNRLEEILPLIPTSVKNYIKSSKFFEENEILEDDSKILIEYENNNVFALVYDLTVDSGVKSSEIIARFGEYGLLTALKLVNYGLIKKENDFYIRTNKRLFRSTKAESKRFKNSYTEFLREDSLNCNGENILRNFSSDLTESQYNEWLQVLADTYNKLDAISSTEVTEPKTIKAFTGLFADVMLNRKESSYEN